MIRVLLIDDEAMILKGLRKLIDWEALGAVIIGEAKDGKAGLELIHKEQPDLVISDIFMPNLDGLAMLRSLREECSSVRVVFLSGYQEFAYARDAVKYGAFDYLLKPVGREDLAAVVGKAVQDIQEQGRYRVLKKEVSPVERQFMELLSAGGKQEELLESMAPLFLTDGGAVCAALRILRKKGMANSDENFNILKFEIYDQLSRYLGEQKRGCILKKDFGTCFFLLSAPDNRKQIRKLVDEAVKFLKDHYPIEIVIGVGAWDSEAGRLKYLYTTAKFSLEMYYFNEQKYIDYDEIQKNYSHSLDEYEENLRELRKMIVSNEKTAQINQLIKETVTLLGSIYYGNRSAVSNGCIVFSEELYRMLIDCGLIDNSYRQEHEEFLDGLRNKPTFHGLKELLLSYFDQLLLRIRLLSMQKESGATAKIKQYMQEHFGDPITLDEVAGHIGMNPAYLSAFFKKETGQNFKSYLTELRMKEAVRLIHTTDMKSYELAKAVGYRDDRQFREKFREFYGVSPQNFRKQKEK